MSFGLMIGAGAVLVHVYLYLRLVRHLVRSRNGRLACAAVLVLFGLLLVFRGPLRDASGPFAAIYPVVVYGWMALAICMLVALLVGDLVRLIAFVHARVRPTTPEVHAARREFLAHTVPRGVVMGGAALAGYGVFRAFTAPEITEIAVRIPKLPSALDGLSIVQLTDVHVGPLIGRRFIDALVAEANALRPDVTVITGDLVDGSVGELGGAVAGLAALRARFGTYFVTGNHDYYSGDVAWCRFLEELGLGVLRNRRVEIGDAGGSFDLIGVDDWSGGRRRNTKGYDLDAALADRDPDRAAVLLAHQPRNFEVAAARGIDLQISGHTHGGQLFPMTAFIGLAWPYSRGLYGHAESHIYVSRGCGFWGPPARIGSPPEIVKLVLTT
jgi:uncharacterized protein